MSAHMIIARMAQMPELELKEHEAKGLAHALNEVNKQFPTSINPKYAALMNLGATAAFIYVPRVINMRTRMRAEAAQRREAGLTQTHYAA